MNARLTIAAALALPLVANAQVTMRQLTRVPVRINGDGTVVVYQINTYAIRQEGTSQEQWLPNLPGGSNVAYAISGDGTTVTGINNHRAWAWREETETVNLGSLGPPGADTMPTGVSSDGSVITGQSNGEAFRWTAATGMQSLPKAAGAMAAAWCVSGNGQVAAGLTGFNLPGTRTACRWTSQGCEPLGTFDGAHLSVAWALSGDGDVIVGWSEQSGAWPDQDHLPFVWTPERGAEPLPLPAGTHQSQPDYVSTDGRLIGGTADLGLNRFYSVQWVWSRNLGVVELNEQLHRMGVTLNGESVAWAKLSADKRSMVFSTAFQGELARYFLVSNLPPFDCGAADVGRSGGLAGGDGRLDNNDFIQFIQMFFDANPRADLGTAGGLRGSDGALDNNDFIAFIGLFFAGCEG